RGTTLRLSPLGLSSRYCRWRRCAGSTRIGSACSQYSTVSALCPSAPSLSLTGSMQGKYREGPSIYRHSQVVREWPSRCRISTDSTDDLENSEQRLSKISPAPRGGNEGSIV